MEPRPSGRLSQGTSEPMTGSRQIRRDRYEKFSPAGSGALRILVVGAAELLRGPREAQVKGASEGHGGVRVTSIGTGWGANLTVGAAGGYWTAPTTMATGSRSGARW